MITIKPFIILAAIACSAIYAPAYCAQITDLSSIDSSARQAALGGSRAVGNVGVESLFANPAAMSTMNGSDFGFCSSMLAQEINYQAIGYRANEVYGYAMGVGIQRAWVDGIYNTERDASGDQDLYVVDTFTYEQSKINFSLSKYFNEEISLGGNLSLHSISAGSADSGSGFSFDLGCEYFPAGELRYGLVINNFMDFFSWNNGKGEHLARKINAGVEYRQNKDLAYLFSMETEEGRSMLFNGGATYRVIPEVELRGGFNQAIISESKKALAFSFGVGVELGMVNIDYAFKPDTEFSNNNQNLLSFRFCFDKKLTEEQRWADAKEEDIARWQTEKPQLSISSITEETISGERHIKIIGEVLYTESVVINQDEAFFFPPSWLGRWNKFEKDIICDKTADKILIEFKNSSYQLEVERSLR